VRARALALLLLVGACSGGGTYVVVRFEDGPEGIAAIDLSVDLGGAHSDVNVPLPPGSRLPLTKGLEIGMGEGAIAIEAVARDALGQPLASGHADGTVARDTTTTLTIRFAVVAGAPDAGVPDAPPPAPDAPPSGLVCDPRSYDFGEVAPATTASKVFTVFNGTAMTTDALATGVSGAGYSLGTDRCAGVRLEPQTSCTVEVKLQLDTAGAAHGILTISAGDLGIIGANLTGTGLGAARLELTPASVSFDDVVVDATASTTLQLANTGGAASETIQPTIDGADFTLGATDCAGTSLPRGGSCMLAVTFRPSTTGPRTATLHAGGASASLSGNGIPPGAIVASTPTFAATAVGAMTTATVTVTNNGGSAATITGRTLGGNDAAAFSVSEDGCSGMAVAAGKTCAFTILFQPSSAGPKLASLTISASPGGQAAATLAATATAQITVVRGGTGSGSVASLPTGLSCPPTCTTTFSVGSVQLAASPAAGATFAGWGTPCSGTQGCTVALTSATTSVEADFTAQTFALDVSTSGNGSVSSDVGGISCGSACSAPYAYGTMVTLTAHPGSGAQLSSWGGACSGSASTCVVNMTAARSVVATFGSTANVTVTVNVTGTGGGSVMSSTGTTCTSASCAITVASGASVTLTPSAGMGSTFAGWSNGACAGSGACTLAPTTSQSVTATFNATVVSHTLTVTKDGTGTGTVSGGGISCGATCTKSLAEGAMVSLSAAPAGDSTFAGWTGGGCSATSPCTVTMGTSDMTVNATFNLVPLRTLSVTVTGTGAGTVTSTPSGISCSSGTCMHDFPEGTMVTLAAMPDASSLLKSWSGACSGAAGCTVNLIGNGGASVTADFEPQVTITVNMHPDAAYPGARVDSTPAGITNCTSGTCSYKVAKGTSVTLTGSVSMQWTTICTSATTCTFHATSSDTFQVYPGYLHFHLGISDNGVNASGQIQISGYGTADVPGTSAVDQDRPIGQIQLDLTWDSGHEGVLQWSGLPGCSVSEVCNTDLEDETISSIQVNDQ
jgi:hypothetical protein